MTQLTGRCVCGALRYRLEAPPLFTHACHCLDCQRKSGTAFAMTTIVMREDLRITQGETKATRLSPRSVAYGCARCDTMIYVESTTFPVTLTLRPGTLDDSAIATPRAHVWVKRKHAWLRLPPEVPQFDEGYERDSTWPAESVARLRAAEARLGAL